MLEVADTGREIALEIGDKLGHPVDQLVTVCLNFSLSIGYPRFSSATGNQATTALAFASAAS